MGVLTFLTQSATVHRWTQTGTENDGHPLVEWSVAAEGVPCRLMHDMATPAGGNEGGQVLGPRCYFEVDTDIKAQDELEIDSVRYAIERSMSPAEGGNHYQVHQLRSGING